MVSLSNKQMLTGLNVLVTRPAHQAQTLSDAIIQQNGQVLMFPTINIEPIADQATLNSTIAQLAKADFAIFTSSNALLYTRDTIANYAPTTKLRFIAVGPSTHKTLIAAGIEPAIYPSQHYNSEGVLDLPELQQITDQRIMIFTGANGRTLIADTLQDRGAIVTTVDCYQRTCPKPPTPTLYERCARAKINAIVSTSQASLRNLWLLMGENNHTQLQQIPLLVISPAMLQLAQRLQWQAPILLAENATDTAILQTLANLGTMHERENRKETTAKTNHHQD